MTARLSSKVYLDSTFNSEHSVTGSNFTNSLPSPSYPSGYFKDSNAVTIPLALDINEGIVSPTFTCPKEGACGMWFKPSGWGLVNTTVSDSLTHSVIDRATAIVPLIIWRAEDGIGIRILFHDGVNPTRTIDCTTCTITDGQWHFASASWSTSGDLFKAYLDGVEIGSLSTTIALTGVSVIDIGLGVRDWVGDLELDGDMDTFTFWNEFKTDWTDMNDRRAGLNDIIPVQ